MIADVEVRQLRDDDVAAVLELSYAALRSAGEVYGWQMPPLDDAVRSRRLRGVRHVLATDPDGAFVAERDGRPVGVALATRRGPLWFLSLLTVATAEQGRGLGRRLLEAASATRGDAAAICSSDDPKALRRYRAAGFDLVPAYSAKGGLDRSLLPRTGCRPGSYDDDRDLVEAVAVEQRGAPHGVDLDYWAEAGDALWVADGPGGRGYAVVGQAGPAALGATGPGPAADLLWTVLAETAQPEVEILWLTGAQQWALDVALAARLSLHPTGTCCLAGPVGRRSPSVPNGFLG